MPVSVRSDDVLSACFLKAETTRYTGLGPGEDLVCVSAGGARFLRLSEGRKRTHLLQLLQHLVMLPPQLRPLGELVLAARSVQVTSHIEVTLL